MSIRQRVYQACFVLATAYLPVSAVAHEFWLEPPMGPTSAGDTLGVEAKVGENLSGNVQVYNTNLFSAFAIKAGDQIRKIDGVLGDRPAASVEDVADGLNIMVFASTARKINYETLEKFQSFAARHDQRFAIDAHRTRALPETDFAESYFRFAKALIKVGDGAGEDVLAGLPFELVMLNNPYTTDGPMQVRLFLNKEPVPNFQIDVFNRADPGVPSTLEFIRTDANGIAFVPRKPGLTLLSAVRIEEPSSKIAAQLDTVWQSLWASLTYRLN